MRAGAFNMLLQFEGRARGICCLARHMASRPDTVVSGMRRCCIREPACQDRPAARLGAGLQRDTVCPGPNRERLVICNALSAAVKLL